MTDVWLNGEFIAIDEAKVSAFDAGFQHGVGVFETMRAAGGRVIDLEKHLARMAESVRVLGLSERMQVEPLAEAVTQTLQRNEQDEARIRVTVTGGDLNMLRSERSAHDPTILLTVQPPTEYPDELFEKGVTVGVAEGRANPADPFAGHKTIWYWPRLRELQVAAGKGASEALWFTTRNHLASGCVSNVMIVHEGVLVTPPARGEETEGAAPSAVLPGVVRGNVLEWAAQEGLQVERSEIDVERLLKASEVFLTNSSWGVLPVVNIEQSPIGNGELGEFTRTAISHWRTRLENGT